ncbi:MAG: SLBB domain-containing protein [Elainellaceae cyanobacterium]
MYPTTLPLSIFTSIQLPLIQRILLGLGLIAAGIGVGFPNGAIAATDSVTIELNQTSPGAPSSPSDQAYTLGAGDRLQIDVFQLTQYSGEFEILVDGMINLPVVGEVYVEGMTLEEATDAITATYSQILRRPMVTLSLVARRSIQIGIAGEVNRPGSYTVALGDAEFPTITQVLEQAGGIRMAADLSQVQVRRQNVGSEQVITVNLQQLLRTGDLSTDIVLRDGDTVFIPTSTNPDIASVAELTTASFASDENQEINIAVVGEVFRPGPYIVTGSARTGQAGLPGGTNGSGQLPTVTRAIQVAGGIKPLADVRQIQVRRATRSGTEQVIEVNLWQLLQAGDLSQDLALQEGDTVFIPTATDVDLEESAQLASASFSPDTIQVNIVGEVDRPGTVDIPPNTPLNRAVLSAGGFTNRARRRSVELVRLNPNGTVSAREIPIDFAQGVNEENNPALRNNDVIIVRRSAAASVSDTLEAVVSPISPFLTLFNFPFQFLRLFD